MNLTGAIVVAFTLIANLAAECRGIARTRATEDDD